MTYQHTFTSVGPEHTGADYTLMPSGHWLFHDPSDPGYDFSLWHHAHGSDTDELIVDWSGRVTDGNHPPHSHGEGFNERCEMVEVRPEQVAGLVMAARHGAWASVARRFIERRHDEVLDG